MGFLFVLGYIFACYGVAKLEERIFPDGSSFFLTIVMSLAFTPIVMLFVVIVRGADELRGKRK